MTRRRLRISGSGTAVGLATMATLCLAIVAASREARAQTFVDFGNVTGVGLPGTTGFADLSLPTMSGSVGYVNIAANFGSGEQWLVQNYTVPLQSTEFGGNAATLGFTFDATSLGATDGTSYAVFADFTTSPLASASMIPSQGSSVYSADNIADLQTTGSSSLDGGGGVSGSSGDAGASASPLTAASADSPQAPGTIIGRVRYDVPGILQAKNECGPTSAVQSLLWMQKRGQISGLPTQAKLLTDIKQAMNPGSPQASGSYQGINRNNYVPGKQTVTANDKIAVNTGSGGNVDGTGTFNYIKQQIENGNDVEMRIQYPGDGGHWVTIAGWYDDGTTQKLFFKDPLTGGDTVDSYTISGTAIQGYKYAGAAGANISFAVAESTAPEPGALPLLATGLLLLIGTLAVRRPRVSRTASF